MTKARLIEDIACVTGMTLHEAKLILETILDSMVKALSKGEEIEIRRFGSFSTHRRAPRTGRNPKTGKRVDVPARRVPRFRPSRELLGLVNGAHHEQQDFKDLLQIAPQQQVRKVRSGRGYTAMPKRVWMNWRCPVTSPFASQRICPFRMTCIAS